MFPDRMQRTIHEILRHFGDQGQPDAGRQQGAQHTEKFWAGHDNQLLELGRNPGSLELMSYLSGERLDLMFVRLMGSGGRMMGTRATSAGLDRRVVRTTARAIRHELSIVQPCT